MMNSPLLHPLASTLPLNDATPSDLQLYQLLKDAEERLRSVVKSASRNSNTQKHSPPSYLQKSLAARTEIGLPSSYIKTKSHGAQINSDLLVTANQRKLACSARTVEEPVQAKSNLAKAKLATAGTDWYNIPRTKLAPELKRDLQLLRLRSVLDPRRHFKKESSKNQFPEFFQVGTIIEGPTEFFSARLTKKDRKRTFIEEVLAGETATQRFKSKYNDIQRANTSGKKAHYKKLKTKRTHRNWSG